MDAGLTQYQLLTKPDLYAPHIWELKLDIHSAPVGKPEYTLALTQRRAAAIRQLLISLGVKAGAITVSGLGDQHALVPNESEKNRWLNTRVEIARL